MIPFPPGITWRGFPPGDAWREALPAEHAQPRWRLLSARAPCRPANNPVISWLPGGPQWRSREEVPCLNRVRHRTKAREVPDAAGGPIGLTGTSADRRCAARPCLICLPLMWRAAKGKEEPAATTRIWMTRGWLTARMACRSGLRLPERGRCGGGGAFLSIAPSSDEGGALATG
ncbi:hypothetical protein NDU88_002850 [Pleurodeles waltl]|uniref:Uncharacterized protein n=1 Tax=Pleurodeles waltl TaxID=8319 RepID=A0AAV7W5R5_PLEWA|nr:hypothetical protein NDU88_002850 [Pleurodeles waltl]